MNGLQQYILSITCASLLCGILCSILNEGFAREIIKLLCAMVLTLTVLQPAMRIETKELTGYLLQCRNEAARASANGEDMARSAISDIIKQESEAYILDKANSLHASVSVDIAMESGLPAFVRVTGYASPYARAQLASILERDLGIKRENQQWT